MKFSTIAISAFAAARVFTAPIAIPHQEPAADLAPADFKPAMQPETKKAVNMKKMELVGRDTTHSAASVDSDNTPDLFTIYLVPNGLLSTDGHIPGSVPFVGHVANGTLRPDTSVTNDFDTGATIGVNSEHQLQMFPHVASDNAALDWTAGDKASSQLEPLNGRTIVSCPDHFGNYFLYAGVSCSGGKTLQLSGQGQ